MVKKFMYSLIIRNRFQKRDSTPSFLSNCTLINKCEKTYFIIFYSIASNSQSLLSGRSTGDTVIEMNSRSTLPPQWVDLYDDTVEKLKQFKDYRK